MTKNLNQNILNKKKDSKEYLKKCIEKQPFVVKAVEILLNDQNFLASTGPPIKLIMHDSINIDKFILVRFFF